MVYLSFSLSGSVPFHSGPVPAGGAGLGRDGGAADEEDGMEVRGGFGEAQGRNGGAHRYRLQNRPQGYEETSSNHIVITEIIVLMCLSTQAL